MEKNKNARSIAFSLVCVLIVGALVFGVWWTFNNKEGLFALIKGSSIYTQTQVDEITSDAYNDGYSDAKNNESYYKKLVATYEKEIADSQSQIKVLTDNNWEYQTKISTLTSERNTYQNRVLSLETINAENEKIIAENKVTISNLKNEVTKLKASDEDKSEEIELLQKQISNLQTVNASLQSTNDLNTQTIVNMNLQIETLNKQISEMTTASENNSAALTSLKNEVESLKKSIEYYEQYIKNLENENQVVATFYFNNSVYNIQVINKGTTPALVNPESTEYVTFNYWYVEVDGEKQEVELSSYPLSANTTFYADITTRYDVKFKVDEDLHSSQIIELNYYPELPAEPVKDGYEFDYWSLNGVDKVNPTEIQITQDTIFVAVFTKLHTVTFIYEDTTQDTQIVRNNEYASEIEVESSVYRKFNGWYSNDVVFDITTTPIVADTVLVANITYSFDVIFKLDEDSEDIHNSQIIELNHYPELPAEPIKDGYKFNGWLKNGILTDVLSEAITSHTTYIAEFERLNVVNFYGYDENEELVILETQLIETDKYSVTPILSDRTGYVFVGWSTDQETVIDISTIAITSDTDFYPIYKIASKTLTYGTAFSGTGNYSTYTTFTVDLSSLEQPITDFKNIAINISSYYLETVNYVKTFGSSYTKINSYSVNKSVDYDLNLTFDEESGLYKLDELVTVPLLAKSFAYMGVFNEQYNDSTYYYFPLYFSAKIDLDTNSLEIYVKSYEKINKVYASGEENPVGFTDGKVTSLTIDSIEFEV
ncbi:MAG: InlB B-repeat-containing protein [Clostridia bacterium]|nr:InlB B-repeat-containing protein [Clostridia bacterium]